METTAKDVVAEHKAFNDRFNLPHSPILPYLYGMPKLHKPTPRMRWIAGVSRRGNVEADDVKPEKTAFEARTTTAASTTPGHQEASGILKLMLRALKEKDAAILKKTGVKRFFIVESVDDVAVHLKTHYTKLRGKKPDTFDFTEMYTKLPQEAIITSTMKAVDEALAFMTAKRGWKDIRVARPKRQSGKKTFAFVQDGDDDDDAIEYDREQIQDLITFIVQNSFVTNGNDCYHQQAGIPMGGNASPDLANLYCYEREKQYIDDLLATGKLAEAQKHAHSFRFIDDFLTWDTTPPPESIYNMSYGKTSKGEDDVVFLGMRIRLERSDDNNFIRMSVLDKGEEFPWRPIKYTHVESTVPRNTGNSIFKGALIRAARICNNMPDLKTEIMKIFYRLRNRGYYERELRRTFQMFLAQVYGAYELDTRVLEKHYFFVRKWYEKGLPTTAEKSFVGNHKPTKAPTSPSHTTPTTPTPTTPEPPKTTDIPRPPGHGIPNNGNSCFFAAAIQLLMKNTTFQEQLATAPAPLTQTIQMLQELFTRHRDGKDLAELIPPIRARIFNVTENDKEQRDASEVIGWMKDLVAEQLGTPERDNTAIMLTRLTTCTVCKTERQANPTPEQTLLIPLNNHNRTNTSKKTLHLDALIRQACNATHNIPAFDCTVCDTRPKGISEETFSLPDEYVVVLKRTRVSKVRNSTGLVKLLVSVALTEKVEVGQDTFAVVGMVIHTGKAEAGHYFTLLKTVDAWVEYNDATITTRTWDECAKTFASNGYIALLRRI